MPKSNKDFLIDQLELFYPSLLALLKADFPAVNELTYFIKMLNQLKKEIQTQTKGGTK